MPNTCSVRTLLHQAQSFDTSHSEQPQTYIAEHLPSHKSPTLKPQNLIIHRTSF